MSCAGNTSSPVIDTAKSERVARPYAQWLAEQNGKPTWKTPIQQDVDAAIAVSLTWKQFLRMLEQRGYTFRFNRKYATLKPPGRDYTVRFKALGEQYTPEAIQRRILYPKPPTPAGKPKHPRPGASDSALGASVSAGSPACGLFTFPIYIR